MTFVDTDDGRCDALTVRLEPREGPERLELDEDAGEPGVSERDLAFRHEARRHLESTARPEELPRAMVDERIAELRRREAVGEGHAVVEHLDVTDAQLAQRALDGTDARMDPKHPERHHITQPPPVNATRFESPAALVRAEAAAWESDTGRERRDAALAGLPEQASSKELHDIQVKCVIPIEEALGPDWRDHVTGRSHASKGQGETLFPPDSVVVTRWRLDGEGTWYCQTCFPSAQ